jgi:hypothetical protein
MQFIISVMLLTAALMIQDNKTAQAVELVNIPRTIGEQPVYQSKSPKYCLLVFGPQAETRVWVVVDGNQAYIDRNANGDLTEEGEQVSSQSGTGFDLGSIKLSGGATHKLGLSLLGESRFSMSIVTAETGSRYVGKNRFPKPQFGDRPQDAPIIHPDGPATLAPYGELTVIPRNPKGSIRNSWLRLTLGSPGHGPCTVTSWSSAVRCTHKELRRARLVADIEFPSRDPRSGPIKSRQTLDSKG